VLSARLSDDSWSTASDSISLV
jgi:hypothetical protein